MKVAAGKVARRGNAEKIDAAGVGVDLLVVKTIDVGGGDRCCCRGYCRHHMSAPEVVLGDGGVLLGFHTRARFRMVREV